MISASERVYLKQLLRKILFLCEQPTCLLIERFSTKPWYVIKIEIQVNIIQ